MASCLVAIDRAHAGNGALNVLRGSHLLGRLDHARQQDPALFSDGTGQPHPTTHPPTHPHTHT